MRLKFKHIIYLNYLALGGNSVYVYLALGALPTAMYTVHVIINVPI